MGSRLKMIGAAALLALLMSSVVAADAQTRNGSAMLSGELSPCYTISSYPERTVCAPAGHWQPAPAISAVGSHLAFEVESAAESEARRADGRAYADQVRRIYGRSATTAPGLNARVYDYGENDFQIFLGGVDRRGSAELVWPAKSPLEATPPSALCGREERRGAVQIFITCPDWPALRRLSGSSLFPDERGVQVFVRSSDPTTVAFAVTVTYRKGTDQVAVSDMAAVHPKYDSGVGWVVGDVELLAVDVAELRESSKVQVR
jgi:hypothetical protein